MPFECVLRIPSTGEDVSNWMDYRWDSDFLTPTDAWLFHLGIEDRTTIPDLVRSTRPGTPIELALVDSEGDKLDQVLASGVVDSVLIESSRGGTEITIAGRDIMSRAIDSMLDPSKFSFQPDQSLFDIITQVLKPFGLTVVDTTDCGDVSFKGAQTRGVRTTKRGKTAKKSLLTEQLKVQKHEGAYAFCARIAKRCGLHLWPGTDGETVYLGKPDFVQDSLFTIFVSTEQEMNPEYVPLKSSAKFDATDQPSAIVASGRSTRPKSGAATAPVTVAPFVPGFVCSPTRPAKPTNTVTTVHTVAMINELVAFDGDTQVIDATEIKTQYPAATLLDVRSGAFEDSHLMPLPHAKIIFLSDGESHSGEQVVNVVRREMANRQRRALDVRYTMAGHTQDDIPWAVDTIVDVQDDILGIHELMYVYGVSYKKSRQSGTTTDLHLVRPYTLDF